MKTENQHSGIAAILLDEADKGMSLSVLCDKFGYKTVNLAMAELATLDPDALEKSRIQPGGTFNLFTDMCLGTHLTLPLYKTFGSVCAAPVLARQNLLKAMTKDKRLYSYVREKGHDAIFTCDTRRRKKSDLCNIAEQAFTDYAGDKDGMDAPPPVIALPQRDYETQRRILHERKDDIVNIIRTGHKAVLHLN